ncbi:MAG: ImmA/IrrE family metallo-endopeptidase [Thermoplasmatota archaeon]
MKSRKTMPRSFSVNINNDALQYAIKTSGYSPKNLSDLIKKRFKVKYFTYDYLKSLTKGKKKPTYSDLIKIDNFIKRGIPFYLLDEVPKDTFLPKFRRKHKEVTFSPETEIDLRNYHQLRKEIKYLLDQQDKTYKRILPIHTIKEDPRKIAHKYRKKLKIDTLDYQNLDSRHIFQFIRQKIEKYNIFVFKSPIEDTIRGTIFLDNKYPALILINSTDDKNAEIFSLLHEFAHYLLNDEMIDNEFTINKADLKIEKWCNSFAYSFMVKKEDEKKEGFDKVSKENIFNLDYLSYLSKKYKISKRAFVYRFYLLNKISLYEYFDYCSSYPYKKTQASGKGGGNYYYTLRNRLSPSFISLVNDNYVSGNISIKETYDYLKIKDIDKIGLLMEVVDS